jgi:TPR repeat protein
LTWHENAEVAQPLPNGTKPAFSWAMKRTHLVWVLLFLFAGISFAASSTDPEMKTNLSGHHRKFENSPLEEVKSKAERGDAEAQCELGIRCWTYHPVHNQGTAKGGAAEAAKWYRKAADQGHAEAQYQLGDLYYSTVNGGEAEAAKWYRKAADQGHAEAQYQLGDFYAEGTGVAKDEVEAIKWFRKAADQGGVWAQYQLGKCYENGTGVSTDAIEAVKWYRKAAEPRDLSTNTVAFRAFHGNFPQTDWRGTGE